LIGTKLVNVNKIGTKLNKNNKYKYKTLTLIHSTLLDGLTLLDWHVDI